MAYFFDTYALFSILKNNPNYFKYSDEVITTSIFNLAEIFYISLRDFGEDDAKKAYRKFKENIIELDDNIIFDAMKFRLKRKNQNLSYADCIGYTLAGKHNLKFLTGDREFEGMENVEFVK